MYMTEKLPVIVYKSSIPYERKNDEGTTMADDNIRSRYHVLETERYDSANPRRDIHDEALEDSRIPDSRERGHIYPPKAAIQPRSSSNMKGGGEKAKR